MNKKMSKRQRDIKTKLMAAICMLLVSSIMMVSTTYAWFTLSTAPEVTGITTAVGANGNLEMALMPLSGDVTKITSGTADSMKSQATTKANITWGNLVDLGATNDKGVNAYGLHEITLYPAKLNGTDKINTSAPLAIPVYGSDGRVSDLDTTSTVTGVYTADDFYQSAMDESNTRTDAPTGVRAIGTVSGMTPQQSAYRGALAAASTVALNAQTAASSALSKEGPQLASIAIEHATDAANESYTKADLQSLLNMVNALLGTEANNYTDGALGMIEAAMRQYLYAIEIRNNTNYADKEADIVGTAAQDPKDFSELTVPSEMTTMISALDTTLGNAEDAKDILEEQIAANKDSYAWDDFDDALTLLANPSTMEINGIKVPDLNKPVINNNGTPDDTSDDYEEKDAEGNTITNMSNLVGSVMTSGLNLILASGSGVYSDVADHCGNYSASITIPSISYGGLSVPNVPANMKTATNVNPVYLTQADNYVRGLGAPGGAAAGTLPITDYYGYIIDLAFRTNAADSYLRLQTKGVDRIYDGNQQNAETLGGGSTMTFKWTDTAAATGLDQTVLNNKAVALMEHIKVIFFDPTNQNTILAYGKLNGNQTTNATTNEITAELILANAAGEPVENLMELEQNKAHRVSVLVYLDGETLSNADVAYTNSTSMTGSLNLQFCSSATLVPMEYSDLRTGANNGGTGNNNQPASPVKVTTVDITENYTAEVYYGTYNSVTGFSAVIKDASSNAVTSDNVTSVTIGGQTATYADGAWVAATSATEAPDSVTVVVTPKN